MAKQQSCLKYIFKIHSSRLRRSKWNLNLAISEAIENEEIVAIADSTALRLIKEIEKTNDIEKEVAKIRLGIKKLKNASTNATNKEKIKELYKNLYAISFVKSYLCIVIDNNQDYDRMNSKKGFYVNGVKFKRLLATTGGAKNSTVIFINTEIYDELNKRIDNGRDSSKPIVPAKLEAYKALSCSASVPVSNPKGILVVNDCETTFLSNIIEIDDSTTKKFPKMRKRNDHPVKLIDSDGYGLMLPHLSKKWAEELGDDYLPSGMCLRGSFTKGMIFSFDFIEFANKIADKQTVKDIWGYEHNISEIELILTSSMLKLWDSYTSIGHYLKCCEENNHWFSVAKVTPKELENERSLNYQFIQSLDLSDSNIEELIIPTINEFKDVLGLDVNKSLLFMNGSCVSESIFSSNENHFSKALMADNSMVNDPFIRNKIFGMIRKRINDAKIGVIKVRGNFSIVSGDPYSLCQSIFGLDVTGLLGSGEFYSKYWSDRNVKNVSCFRAPMTCHNNIRMLNVVNNPDMAYWYRYMDTVTIFNSWDTTSHALNGLDKDADAVLTTDNQVILTSVRELDAILCVQKSTTKKVPSEEDLIQANKDSFGDEIGKVTNRITSMFDVQANFEKGSKEYRALEYRIQSGQHYQQNAIDKAKGIKSKEMPREWHDYHAAKTSKDRDINLKILADKQPYFFTYIYPNKRNLYKKHVKAYEENCGENFRCALQELLTKTDRTQSEEKFVQNYYRYMPVSISPSVMNRLCWKVENEFDGFKTKNNKTKFDYTIMKTIKKYKHSTYEQIKELYDEYKGMIKDYSISNKNSRQSEEELQSARIVFKKRFKQKAFGICNDEEELCNIVLDMCYRSDNSKQFAWDTSGDQIVKNLLDKNNNYITTIVQSEIGDIEYGGNKYKVSTVKLEHEVLDEISDQ